MLRLATAAACVALATGFSPLLARRSVVKYDTAKAVAPEVVTKALEAAILAPNHFLSEPWRFYDCGAETKAALCNLNSEKTKAFEGVPGWTVVTCVPDVDDAGQLTKLGLEDHAAVARDPELHAQHGRLWR